MYLLSALKSVSGHHKCIALQVVKVYFSFNEIL